MKRYTAYFAFVGSAGGAYGFQQAETHLAGVRAGFEILGGFDIDPDACANAEYLTGVPMLCADARKLTPEQFRASAQGRKPELQHDLGAFMLSGGGSVWVRPEVALQ